MTHAECSNPAHTRLSADLFRFKRERNEARALAGHQAEALDQLRYQLVTTRLTHVLTDPDDFLRYVGIPAVTEPHGTIDLTRLDALAAELTRQRPYLAARPQSVV